MENYYSLLGLNTSASNEEIRRAYRILARRYHPDVNPGKASEDKFKKIAEAYRVLSDAEKRKTYDAELENHLRAAGSGTDPRINAYRRAQGAARPSARQRFYEAKYQEFGKTAAESGAAKPAPEAPVKPGKKTETSTFAAFGRKAFERMFGSDKKPASENRRTTHRPTRPRPPPQEPAEHQIAKISLIEVSVTMSDVVNGVKKTVEITEPEGTRKVSVKIPAGVRNGSVVHLRSKGEGGEDLVIIVRVASHPYLSMHTRGLVAEVPISVNEAISGASVTLPSLEEPVSVKIPPGTQSGAEIRMKGRGVINKDGSRGDLIYRLMIRVPEAQNAVGFTERAGDLEKYYPSPVRHALPKTLLETS